MKKLTTMPVALATAATERSISPHRITKVSPTAMIPVTEIWVRMLARLSSVAKAELASVKKTTRQSSVANGAMLRIWLRRKDVPRGGVAACASGNGTVMGGAILLRRPRAAGPW